MVSFGLQKQRYYLSNPNEGWYFLCACQPANLETLPTAIKNAYPSTNYLDIKDTYWEFWNSEIANKSASAGHWSLTWKKFNGYTAEKIQSIIS